MASVGSNPKSHTRVLPVEKGLKVDKIHCLKRMKYRQSRTTMISLTSGIMKKHYFIKL